MCAPLYKLADSLYGQNEKKESIYCKCRLASCMTRQGKLDESQEIAAGALQACTKDLVNERADILNTIGMNYLGKGRQDLAEEYFNNSLNQFSGNDQSISKAQCYNNIALLNWLQGNQQKAIEHMEQALQMRMSILGNTHALIAASYNDLGLIYSNENPQKAIEYYNQALNIYKIVYPLNHPSIAVALNNIGIIQRKQGDPAASLITLEKSLQIWSSLYGPDHTNVAFVYSNMGESYLESDQAMTALEYQQKALDVYKKNYGEKHPEIASTYNSIGNIYSDMENYKEALANFQNAIYANVHDFNNKDIYVNPVIKNYYNPDVLLVSLIMKSRMLENLHYSKTLKLDDLKISFNTLAACDTLIGKLRQIRTSSKDKIELGKLGSEIYEDAISTAFALSEVTLKKKYYLEKAFYYSEKNKGSVLLESIADANAKSFAGIPDTILEKEKSLKNEISFLEQKIAQGPKADEEKAYRNKLFELNRVYEQLIEGLEKNYPEYFNLKYNTRTLSVKDIQRVLNPDEAILSYFLAENKKRIFVFIVSKQSFKVKNIPLNADFNKEVATFRNAIKLNISAAYIKSAYNIYKDIFPARIAGKVEHLIVIPDGKLGSIPYEALISQKPKETTPDFRNLAYLIKKYSFSYNYSSILFFETRNKEKDFQNLASSILLCAPVNFDASKRLKSLPGTAAEVSKIDELFKNNNANTKVLLNEEANEKNIKSTQLKNYKFIHLATHGIVNEDKPELSQIFLHASEDKKEDGDLFSGEIYNLEIKADLVVLSACQTGLGKIKKGEGIIGLSRALIYAGANNVMVSLWTVSDESTSELMIDFYGTLLFSKIAMNYGSYDYYLALRRAKLALIKEGKFSQPYYWAPFILIGN
ncbi:MAG: CHAT domain-containing protein [Cytophagaceae bacterium]|nr:CHAT domain-containing protein [Cytophagaceae bacterium]